MKKNIIYLILILFSTFLNANEKIVLQLKWFHQFQFAGYYAAKEKGFYDEVGLNVEIRQRDLKYNNIDEVINGNAQYGVADSILILYRLKQQPVVIVSPIFQHSPSVFISLKKSNISSVYELNNKDILFYPNDTDGFSLLAMIKKFDLDVNLVRERYKDDYMRLINNEVDVMPAYIANEPFLFKEKGYDVNIINPTNYGFDMYGDMLFTNEDEAKNNPIRVEKFKEATLKGWKYALENKEEIIQLINEKYSKEKSIEHLRYEANAIDSLINKDVTPLGYLDQGRIRYISEMYEYYGLTESKIDLNDFLFDEISKKDKKLSLSDEEIKYLKDNPILKVHNFDSLPPYNFTLNNYPKGFVIDYIQLVGKVLGVKIEFIQNKSLKESFDMLENNQLDILPNIAISDERKKTIDFTNYSLVNFQISLGVNKQSDIKSLSDLKNKKVSVVENFFLEDILKKEYPSIILYKTKNTEEAIEAVASNKADAVIHNLSTIEYLINKNWLSNLKTIVLKDDNIDYTFDLNEFLSTNKSGKLIYEDDVKKFLNALTTNQKYPFSTPEMRDELKHTFWLVGNRISSAKAFEQLLKNHPVFGQYEIILAAGDGKKLYDDNDGDDFEEEQKYSNQNTKALDRVKEAIKNHDKTITLSVGQLTTGVTVPEWSAVLMLSDIKSPASYMQAAFRAQNPHKFIKDGQLQRKKSAYVFDFAPTRVLTIFDEFANSLLAAAATGQATTLERKANVAELLNFFPVISEDRDGQMIELDAEQVLTFPKSIKAQEIVKRGFISNLLFTNISNIFNIPREVIETLNKMPTENNKRARD